MNYFFMPRVPGLVGSVTMCNFLCTRGQFPEPPAQKAYVAWSDGEAWQIRKLRVLEVGESVTFLESDLPDDTPSDASPFFFMSDQGFPNSLDAMPSINDYDTTPSWRGNIQMVGKTASVSYQGEYPAWMVQIQSGTLLSLCPLVQSSTDVLTRLVLPNMRSNPKIEACRVVFATMRTRKVIGEGVAYRNKCSIIDIPPSDGDDPVCVVSDEITGIPLYLTHTPNFAKLSFEHSLAPLQMMLMDDKTRVQGKMKSWWLGEFFA